MWKYCKICCVNITIYAGSYKYLKGKKSTYGKTKKKTVATVQNVKKKSGSPKYHCRWIVKYIEWTVSKHCSGIAAFYIVR